VKPASAASDLYETLGVDRKADAAAIRRAYRRAAKKAHPDSDGGSPEKFAAIRTALKVLTDDRARTTYDQTGRIEEPEPDQAEGKAAEIAFMTLMEVVAGLEGAGGDPARHDLVALAIRHLDAKRAEGRSRVAKAKRDGERGRKVAERFRPKLGKANRLGAMFVARAVEIERNVAKMEAEMTAVDAARVLLAEHVFEVEAGRSPDGLGVGVSPFVQILSAGR